MSDLTIQELVNVTAQRDRLAKALISIALNSCCEGCQEAKKVAMAALDWHSADDKTPRTTLRGGK